MNDEYLIKMYLDWLIAQVDHDDKAFGYDYLFDYLFNTDFVWLANVPLDENRAADGLELRGYFAKSIGLEDGARFINLLSQKQCSVLEMLVAFADRLTNLFELDRYEFFWMFIDNLGLNWANDREFDVDIVSETIRDFMYGTVHGREPKGHENPPVLFPCREVYNNMNSDLYLQANLYLKSYYR